MKDIKSIDLPRPTAEKHAKRQEKDMVGETPSQPSCKEKDKNRILHLEPVRQKEAWESLSARRMKELLCDAQCDVEEFEESGKKMVICGGCGRVLEPEYMELDHITPKAQRGKHDITNRILLCRPCNLRKGTHLTLIGLLKENKRRGWLQDDKLAKLAQDRAWAMADIVRDINFH